MTSVLVKITVDLYAPGAVLRANEFDWMDRWDKFHSRRIVVPIKPMQFLAQLEDRVWIVKEDFCHIRLSSLDDTYGGVMDSEFDYNLAGIPLDKAIGNHLESIAQKALVKAPPFNPVRRTHVAWLELWDAKTMESVCDVQFEQIIEACKQ